MGAARSVPPPSAAAWPLASQPSYQLPAPRAADPITSRAAAQLPPGWTTVGGIALPTLGALAAAPSVSAAPLSWPFSWLSPTLPSAATAVPGLAAFSGRHCGAANLDGRRIPLDCMTSDYATIPWAQLPVVRHGFFDRDGYVGDTPLPALVDHRTSGAHGLVRDQGPAGTCTAVSFATAVDHAVGRALGGTVSVSAMHTWSRYATPRMSADYRNAPSGHAMVLAGYKRQTNGTYFLIQNSWGRRWGDGGFAWIHEATLQRNLHSAFVVDAKPRRAQNGLPAEPPIAPQPACAAGQGPDSVTEVCAPFCPDGSRVPAAPALEWAAAPRGMWTSSGSA